jgi:8-oxo-dGTP pyrophosphatase MutT (NUDIX family)
VDRMDGPTPMQWAERLGLSDPAEAVAFVLAAVREAFEETGILLARLSDDATNPGGREGLEIARRALLADVVDMRQVIVTRSLRIAADELLYLAHWITPEPEPRRYDTRFFLARVGADSVCEPHEEEATESVWLTARGALHFFQDGSLRMLPPTVHTLRRLAGFATVEEIFAALRDAPVPAILPVMRVVPDGVTIEMPPEGRE